MQEISDFSGQQKPSYPTAANDAFAALLQAKEIMQSAVTSSSSSSSSSDSSQQQPQQQQQQQPNLELATPRLFARLQTYLQDHPIR